MRDPDLPVTLAALHRWGRCRETSTVDGDDAAGDWWVCGPRRVRLIPAPVR